MRSALTQGADQTCLLDQVQNGLARYVCRAHCVKRTTTQVRRRSWWMGSPVLSVAFPLPEVDPRMPPIFRSAISVTVYA